MSPAMRRALASVGVLLLATSVVMGAALAAPGQAKPKSKTERHRSLTEGLDCSSCHTQYGWKQLGQGAGSGGFDHARTGFPLTGQHARSACVDCHSEGTEVTRDCVGCHADAHQRRLGVQCDDCHTSTSFQDVRGLELHRLTRLPLTGMHSLVDCTSCHARIGDRRFAPIPADCFACHEREYRSPTNHPLHVGSATNAPFPRDCAQCHRATGWSQAVVSPGFMRGGRTSAALSRAPAEHDLVFPISFGSHRHAQCADCHRSEQLPRAVRCTGCHEHSPARLSTVHRSVSVQQRDGACLSCHPGGAAR